MKNRMFALGALLVGMLAVPAGASAHPCTTFTTSDGRTFTAHYYNEPVPATATGDGCDIVAAFDDGAPHAISGSDISGAPRFGVLADKESTVTIDDSHVHDIGDLSSGVQAGVAIEYVGGADGSVSDSTIDRYQKNGFVIADDGTNVDVVNNTIDGGGPTSVIARNGVQYSDFASGLVRNNLIQRHQYTGCSAKDSVKTGCTWYQSAGLFLFNINEPEVDASLNKFRDNDKNQFNIPAAAVR